MPSVCNIRSSWGLAKQEHCLEYRRFPRAIEPGQHRQHSEGEGFSSKHLKFFNINLFSIQNLIQQRGNFADADIEPSSSHPCQLKLLH